MEEHIQSEKEEDDVRSAEEMSTSLRAAAKQIGEAFLECEAKVRSIVKQVEEDIDPIHEAELIPKDKAKKWLEERELPSQLVFEEFFQAFLMEHKKEDRLDLSTRSIHLNEAACTLLGYKKSNVSVPILDLLVRLASLFE